MAHGWCSDAVCIDLHVVDVCGIVFPWKCGTYICRMWYMYCVCVFSVLCGCLFTVYV